MRVVLQLPYPGHLRFYGSTVRELSARGHEVMLSYDSPAKRRDPAAAEVESLPGVAVVPGLPAAGRRLARFVDGMRQLADYLRFVDRRYAETPYLRRRLEKYVPRRGRRALRLASGSREAAIALLAYRLVERLLRADRRVVRALSGLRPDVVVVSPGIARGPSGARQTETLKAARRLRIPVALGVSSWDHLTTKGIIKVPADRIFVWNDVQLREAVELHGVPAARVVPTGAQLFDQWFDREPSVDRATFVRGQGLDPGSRYVLYVGSSPNITEAAREEAFVRTWVKGLREAAGAPELRELGVLVRPHPGNMAHWARADLGSLGVAIAPRMRPEIPMSESDEALYFDSIHFASAVVGINTSAIIESLVQRRPVLTIRAHEFAETQEGTLHFHYLVPEGGGCVRAARTLEEHLVQLQEVLANPEGERDAIERFLRAFVRPRGLEHPATPVLVDEIEALARRGAR
jgi:hypothetical protein